jgi:hypothetical protein
MNVAGINFTSAGAELAAMLVEHEANQAESDQEQMEAYQRKIEREAEKEYRAAMAAADAGGRAALVGGAMGILSSGATVAGAYESYRAAGIQIDSSMSPATQDLMRAQKEELAARANLLTAAGTPFQALNGCVQSLGGGMEKERQQARAQQCNRTIQQMQSEADQLAQQARRSEQRSDAALDHAAKFVESDNARANAVLSNF